MNFYYYIIAFATSIFVNHLIQNYFLKRKFIDNVNYRSSHKSIATRSGGLSIFITVFIISFISYLLSIQLFDYSFLVPLMLIVAVGIYDDIYNVDFKLKFLFQIIFAKIIIDNGLAIDNLHGFMGIYELNRMISQLITIIIIVAIINAINFIDGIDGLAISIIIMFIGLFEILSFNITQFQNLSLLVLSALLPMYYFNFKKDFKIFLGDSGSYFLGGIISIYVLYICSNVYIIKPAYDLNKIFFVFSILSYPIIDIIRVFIIRLKNGKSPFIADKNHIHHILLTKLVSHKMVTISIIGASTLILILVQLIF
jgi:UDP-GlcNAc:undecaprenyl-phosphate/decaprenyl-phosphate GlcNAc-1-phosphate transferase